MHCDWMHWRAHVRTCTQSAEALPSPGACPVRSALSCLLPPRRRHSAVSCPQGAVLKSLTPVRKAPVVSVLPLEPFDAWVSATFRLISLHSRCGAANYLLSESMLGASSLLRYFRPGVRPLACGLLCVWCTRNQTCRHV